jgi:AraC-like DNA-binding protein
MVVQDIFEKLDYPPVHISLGEVETTKALPPDDLEKLRKALVTYGFEMIDDGKSRLIEKIKTLIIDMVHYKEQSIKINHSSYIESALHKDYTYLSNLFSEITGVTIEKYIISQKIERVKELLVYDELTLSEIAHELGYSSVSYLSVQFRKVTGLTPGHFKKIKEKKRKPLDKV